MGFAAAALPALLLAGCIEEPPLAPPGTPVFSGGFPTGVEPKAFAGSRLNALGIDSYETLGGIASMRIDVPRASATPGFAGGVVEAATPQDLSGSNALSFWSKSSRPATLDTLGFGLAFDDPSVNRVTLFGLPLTEEWTHHVIPIPDPGSLTAERGLFWYAESDPVNYSFWLAGMGFVQVDPGLLDLRPSLGAAAVTVAAGRKAPVPLVLTWADLDGTRRALDGSARGEGPPPSYFRFSSSDSSIATVDASGVITGIRTGQALIEARLGQEVLPVDLVVNVVASLPSEPAAGPPAPPARAAGDVISFFSDAYARRNVNLTPASFSVVGSATTPSIAGNPVLRYTGMRFVGIDFVGAKVDASAMTHLHVDVWSPDATKFGIQLVAFPAGGGAVPVTVGLNGRTTYAGTLPPFSQGAWLSLDIPLTLFAGLPLDSLGQLLWLDNAAIAPGGDEDGTFYIDNVYFYR
jgi:hypothetical protein